MILFLDTSSLVKLYIDEVGSGQAWHLVDASAEQWVSVVTYAEARAALARRRREGSLGVEDYGRVIADLNRDWSKLNIVPVDQALVEAAGALAERHALHGFDAIQLACALRVRETDGVEVTVSTHDERLARAARVEGLGPP